MTQHPWYTRRDQLQALADDEILPAIERIQVLTAPYFHVARDAQAAGQVVRQIESIVFEQLLKGN